MTCFLFAHQICSAQSHNRIITKAAMAIIGMHMIAISAVEMIYVCRSPTVIVVSLPSQLQSVFSLEVQCTRTTVS